VTTSSPIVWIIDAEQWPRACLRAELIERGYDAVGFVELDAALAALRRPAAVRPALAVLELRGQAIDEARLDALSTLPILLLGGAAELADPVLHGRQFARVLPRPVSLGAVADTVEELVRSKRPEPI
jgi:DNA-binding response OmpR family regulator